MLAQYGELLLDGPHAGSGMAETLRKMQQTTWGGTDGPDPSSEDDALFAHLVDFREEIRSAEARLASARAAREALASLSSPHSALTALENARKLLYDVPDADVGPLFDAVERTHGLLNDAEASLNDCARSIDGDSGGGVIATLEGLAGAGIPVEEADAVVADWNALARKHGISVRGSSLYACRAFPQSEVLSSFSCRPLFARRIPCPTATRRCGRSWTGTWRPCGYCRRRRRTNASRWRLTPGRAGSCPAPGGRSRPSSRDR